MAKKQIASVRKIGDIINPAAADYRSEFSKVDQYINKPMIFIGIEEFMGDKDKFIHIEAIDILSGEGTIVSTGSKYVVKAMHDIAALGGFPVVGTFKRFGNGFAVDDCAVPRNTDINKIMEDYLYGGESATQTTFYESSGE